MDPLNASSLVGPTLVAVFNQSDDDSLQAPPTKLTKHSSSFNSADGPLLSPDNSCSGSKLVDNSRQCTARLGGLVNSDKFSDVTLCVGTSRYPAHRLILANASDVMEQMLMSSAWKESSSEELVLQEHDSCTEVFEDFLRYIYTGCVRLNHTSVLGLLVLADKYNVIDLKDSCSQYMNDSLVTVPDESRVIVWYQYSIMCGLTSLQTACLHYIILNMDSVLQSADWVCLDKEHLISLLHRSDMVVESESVLLLAVVRWLTDDSRVDEIQDYLRDIIPHIRFPMILPEHLYEFEQTPFYRTYSNVFQSYLLTAYRYHALSIKGRRDYGGTLNVDGTHLLGAPINLQYSYRNYTSDAYNLCVDLVRPNYRTCPRVSSKVEKAMSLPVSVSNAMQERQSKLKVIFFPQGFYATSLWNGQLNIAKSNDLTRLTVTHRGGVELSRADVSIIIYAHRNGQRYADHALNMSHTFEIYGQLEVGNVIDLERLKSEDSEFIIDGSVYIRVFVRPHSFFTSDNHYE